MDRENGTRRSDRTKAAILTAARERFAADGYAKATIRAIATQAGIDPSMVMRYYGSKEKLLAAAAEFELELPDLTAIPAGSWGDVLAHHLIARWERNDTLVALLRVAATQEFAAERMRTLFAGQVAPLVARIEPDEQRAATRAGLLATQMLGIALTRYVLLLPPVVALTPDALAAWLAPVLQHYLTGEPIKESR